MSADFPTLAEVIAEHRWTGGWITDGQYGATCACGWERNIANTHRTGLQLHGEHVEQVWREARTIRTREQLDALPVGSVAMALWDYLPHYTAVQHTDGWVAQGSWNIVFPLGSGRNGETALLLWHPDWAQS